MSDELLSASELKFGRIYTNGEVAFYLTDAQVRWDRTCWVFELMSQDKVVWACKQGRMEHVDIWEEVDVIALIAEVERLRVANAELQQKAMISAVNARNTRADTIEPLEAPYLRE